jgi:hypothetical protein
MDAVPWTEVARGPQAASALSARAARLIAMRLFRSRSPVRSRYFSAALAISVAIFCFYLAVLSFTARDSRPNPDSRALWI